MEDPRALTDAEVRDRFSAFHDRELSPDENAAVRAAIERSPELRKEYDGFCRLLDGLSGLGDVDEPAPAATPRVDLLKGVQSRLHKRSGGKFYRDRWSRVAGVFPVELVALVVLVALVLAYLGMTAISVRPAPQEPGVPGTSGVPAAPAAPAAPAR